MRSLMVAVVAFGLAGLLLAQGTTPTEYTAGQKIEVREGDTWSAVTVVKREGRRYQIKYEDGTEEWVTTDRMRAAGAAPKTTDPKVTDPKTTDPKVTDPKTTDKPKPKPAEVFQSGAKIEVKWGGGWRKATVVNRRDGWYLINYDGWRDSREWVEPWRVRKIGSTEDVPTAHPNPTVRNNEGPPRPTPGEMPEDPFKRPAAGERPDPFAPKPFSQTVTDAVRTNVKKALPHQVSGKWAYTPGPAAPTKAQARPIAAKGGGEAFGTDITLSVNGDRAIVTYKRGSGSDVSQIWAETFDLATGQAQGPFDSDKASLPIAITPDGKRILARAEGFFGGTKHRLDVWTPGQGKLAHERSFIPYTKESVHATDLDIQQLLVLDDKRVITINWAGKVVCWDVEKASAIWEMELGRSAKLELSPDRKVIAGNWENAILLIDVDKGDVLASIPARGATSALAFSPDGKKLVGTGSNVLQVWDLTTGVAEPLVGLTVPSSEVAMANNDLVLFKGFKGISVFDLTAKAYVLNYTGELQAWAASGGKLVGLLRQGQTWAVNAWVLPHDRFAEAIKLPPPEVQRDPNAPVDLFNRGGAKIAPIKLAGGGKVFIDMQVNADARELQAINDAIAGEMKRRGVDVAVDAPLRIVARTEDGKSETRSYETFGPGGRQRQDVTVTEKISRLSIERDGVKLWEIRTVTMAGGMVALKQGQGIQDAVNEQNKYNTMFFKTAAIPEIIVTSTPNNAPSVKLVLGGVQH